MISGHNLYAILDKEIGKYKLYKYNDSYPNTSFIPVDEAMYTYRKSKSLLLEHSILEADIPTDSNRYELFLVKPE